MVPENIPFSRRIKEKIRKDTSATAGISLLIFYYRLFIPPVVQDVSFGHVPPRCRISPEFDPAGSPPGGASDKA